MDQEQTKRYEDLDYPTEEQIEEEIIRTRYTSKLQWNPRNIVYTLVTVAAIAVLVATFLMPVLKIYGSSMNPTLVNGDITLTIKGSKFKKGDIIAFYYNNKVLVKRVVATQGEWVDIDEDGNVYVDGKLIDEPYLKEKAFGECDITLPYQVPEDRIFVMGDNRSVSIDSRNTSVGCVSEDQIVGKLVLRVWPLFR